MRSARVLGLVFFCSLLAGENAWRADAASAGASPLALVVVLSRHGVRSPTNATELDAYAARPGPPWNAAPGDLTAHGAELMTDFGAAYRARYAALGLVPAAGCPAPDTVFIWNDVDARTRATGAALRDGFAPHCGLVAHDLGTAVDPLFHALPTIARADTVAARASLAGSIGDRPDALVAAYGLAFAKLDAILGCSAARCTRISTLPSSLKADESGLVSLTGPVAIASTAVEDLILAFAEGKAAADVGWGKLDAPTLVDLSVLHELKFDVDTRTPYAARAGGSNLMAHVLATLDQGATGMRDEQTRAPVGSRFVALVGHDTNVAALGGLLRIHWLLPGYARDDTPPGGALVFELYRPASPQSAYVRVYYTAQSLEDMRRLRPAPIPERAPVFVPGCPSFDCPIATFDRVSNAAIDPTFVGAW